MNKRKIGFIAGIIMITTSTILIVADLTGYHNHTWFDLIRHIIIFLGGIGLVIYHRTKKVSKGDSGYYENRGNLS